MFMFTGVIVAASVVLHDAPPASARVYETQQFSRLGDCLLWADQTTRKLWYYDMVALGAYCRSEQTRPE